jgi:hypothetical protein
VQRAKHQRQYEEVCRIREEIEDLERAKNSDRESQNRD